MNRTQHWEQEIRTTLHSAGREFQQLVTHVNDRIVPEVRTGAETAMRTAAGGLRRAADWMDATLGERRV